MSKPARKTRTKSLPPLESVDDFLDRLDREAPPSDDDQVLRDWLAVQILARDAAVRAHALHEAQS